MYNSTIGSNCESYMYVIKSTIVLVFIIKSNYCIVNYHLCLNLYICSLEFPVRIAISLIAIS